MTPEKLEKHYYTMDTPDGLNVYLTSGTSSGRRKKVFYSEEDDRFYLQTKAKIFADFLRDADCRIALSDVGTGHAAATADRVFRMIGMACDSVSFDQPVSEHVQRLLELKPDVLYTMPSILDHLVSCTPADPRAFGLKKLILVGEIASRRWQKNMSRTLGLQMTDILDTYGSIELGTLAYYSHRHDRYLLADRLYGEGIQPGEAGLSEEKLGENESVLVLTAWKRTWFPAVRFVTCDVVRDFRTVFIDGKPRQSFHSVVKRVGPEWKHGEKISLYDIEEVVCRYADRTKMRVEVRDNALTVWIEDPGLDEHAAERIAEKIESRIPEIGEMIKNGILDRIRVRPITPDPNVRLRPAKNKKLFYPEVNRNV